MARRMIEAMLVGDDSYVRQPAEEYQGAKLVLLFFARRREGRPVRTRWSAAEIKTRFLIGTPNKTGAIERVRPVPRIVIRRTQMRLNSREQEPLKTSSDHGPGSDRRD